jgi:hypothetical protein
LAPEGVPMRRARGRQLRCASSGTLL